MALIKCPECGKEVSDKAPSCIHCGFPLSSMPKVKEEEEQNKILCPCKIFDKVYDLSEFVELHNKNKPYQAALSLNRIHFEDDVIRPYLIMYYFKHHCIPQEIENDDINTTYDEISPDSHKIMRIWKTQEDNYVEVKTVEVKTVETKPEPPSDPNVIRCPRCKSTAITTGARGYSFLTGFIGSGKTVNRCGNCGYKWTP